MLFSAVEVLCMRDFRISLKFQKMLVYLFCFVAYKLQANMYFCLHLCVH